MACQIKLAGRGLSQSSAKEHWIDKAQCRSRDSFVSFARTAKRVERELARINCFSAFWAVAPRSSELAIGQPPPDA